MSSVTVHDRYSIKVHHFFCSGLLGDLLQLVNGSLVVR